MRWIMLLLTVALAGCADESGVVPGDDGVVVVEVCLDEAGGSLALEEQLALEGIAQGLCSRDNGCFACSSELFSDDREAEGKTVDILVFEETAECEWTLIQTFEDVDAVENVNAIDAPECSSP